MAGGGIMLPRIVTPNISPSVVSGIIIHTLETKRLVCSCEVSKIILQFAIKILLSENNVPLCTSSIIQNLNNIIKPHHNVEVQTDFHNMTSTAVQTEKCRIKLQNNRYRYKCISGKSNKDVATQVESHNFSGTKTNKRARIDSKKVSSNVDKTASTEKHQKKKVPKKQSSPKLHFHGKNLIRKEDKTHPINIPLVCCEVEKVSDPRLHHAADIKRHSGSSVYLSWNEQHNCNVKISAEDDEKTANVFAQDSDIPIEVLDKKVENAVSTNPEFQQVSMNKKPQRRATITEGLIPEQVYPQKCDRIQHVANCLCNLTPREACPNDPRIKLICRNVPDLKTVSKRCYGQFDVQSKRRKLDVNQQNNLNTQILECHTPECAKHSPMEELNTPESSILLTPSSVCSQETKCHKFEGSEQLEYVDICTKSALNNEYLQPPNIVPATSSFCKVESEFVATNELNICDVSVKSSDEHIISQKNNTERTTNLIDQEILSSNENVSHTFKSTDKSLNFEYNEKTDTSIQETNNVEFVSKTALLSSPTKCENSMSEILSMKTIAPHDKRYSQDSGISSIQNTDRERESVSEDNEVYSPTDELCGNIELENFDALNSPLASPAVSPSPNVERNVDDCDERKPETKWNHKGRSPTSLISNDTSSRMSISPEISKECAPEVNPLIKVPQWFQQQSFQNWCGQANGFTSTHFQSYYPPYSNSYFQVQQGWPYYSWWNI